MAAIDTTARDFTGALARIANAVRKPSALDQAIADMPAKAAKTLAEADAGYEASTRAAARNQPWRIARLLGKPSCWPVDGMTLPELLDLCRRRVTEEEGRRGHWTHDGIRLIELRACEAVLIEMIRDGDTTPVHRDARATVIRRPGSVTIISRPAR